MTFRVKFSENTIPLGAKFFEQTSKNDVSFHENAQKLGTNFSEREPKIVVNFFENYQKANANFGAIQTVTEYVGGERYDGAYDITPKIEAQTLPTAKKVLERDVNIGGIPYTEVQNNANGKTVTIG